MIEVEVKLPVADLDTIKGKLLKMGFRETAFIEECDTYFDNRQGDISVRGKVILQSQGKEFFTWHGKDFFT